MAVNLSSGLVALLDLILLLNLTLKVLRYLASVGVDYKAVIVDVYILHSLDIQDGPICPTVRARPTRSVVGAH